MIQSMGFSEDGTFLLFIHAVHFLFFTRFCSLVQRDMCERGRQVKGIIEQYLRTVKPAHDRFVGPSIRYADLIIPSHDEPHNNIAIDILAQYIIAEVSKRGVAAVHKTTRVKEAGNYRLPSTQE
jgi:uridine kinase